MQFQGKVLKPRGIAEDEFVLGRMAMTCCADDTTFLGFICKSRHTKELKPGQWIQVRGKVMFEFRRAYRGKGPVISVEHVKGMKALEEELVYFN